MIVKPIKLKTMFMGSNHIYGLDDEGNVWYRRTLPYPSTSYNTSYVSKNKSENEEEEAAKMAWRQLCMNGKLTDDDRPPSKDIPPEVLGAPVQVKEEALSVSADAPLSERDMIDLESRDVASLYCGYGE